jgi:hypothetical protein
MIRAGVSNFPTESRFGESTGNSVGDKRETHFVCAVPKSSRFRLVVLNNAGRASLGKASIQTDRLAEFTYRFIALARVASIFERLHRSDVLDSRSASASLLLLRTTIIPRTVTVPTRFYRQAVVSIRPIPTPVRFVRASRFSKVLAFMVFP